MKIDNVLATLIVFLLMFASFGVGLIAQSNDVETVVEYKNNTIEVEKEVIVDNTINYIDRAVNDFLTEVEAEDDIDILGNYNFDEVSVKKAVDTYTVFVDDDDVTIVEFDIRLKFDDENEREINSYSVRVTYEDDEDTIVELI